MCAGAQSTQAGKPLRPDPAEVGHRSLPARWWRGYPGGGRGTASGAGGHRCARRWTYRHRRPSAWRPAGTGNRSALGRLPQWYGRSRRCRVHGDSSAAEWPSVVARTRALCPAISRPAGSRRRPRAWSDTRSSRHQRGALRITSCHRRAKADLHPEPLQLVRRFSEGRREIRENALPPSTRTTRVSRGLMRRKSAASHAAPARPRRPRARPPWDRTDRDESQGEA